jgi:hypothetical protein
VSLGRFHDCNLLETGNFRRHGVEDEPSINGDTFAITGENTPETMFPI